ncbi:MAG: ABC transporter permease [Mobiluncus porci]|uniref:ABC transporter permease n=1 Tax=Mobiluncus porci TaxID=2652278 RepID=UPI0023F24147|nr:ABC transporter permease [Mobiluncus porci]MDD7541391.1 ABC transporter permease [Mobiluncus porci]MDY5747874.1 ABC transporter permease [Mobiluncus porci]
MSKIFLIAGREFSVRMRAKSTIATIVVTMVIILGAGILARVFVPTSIEPENVGVTAETRDYAIAFNGQDLITGQIDGGLPSDFTQRYQVETFPDDAALEQAVKNGEISMGIAGTLDQPVLVSDGSVSFTSQMMVDLVYKSVKINQYLVTAGVDLKELGNEVSGLKLQVKDVSGQDKAESQDAFNFGAYLVIIVMIMVLFAIVMSAGQLVASGIVEEKVSRVVEVLISTVSPSQLLIGKIIGITAVGIISMICIGGSGIAALLISGLAGSIRISVASFSGWYVVWFLLGLATYMVLYAGAGAMVSRQEEIGQAIIPLVLVQMAGFYTAVLTVFFPNHILIKVASMLPFLNCYAMPARQITSSTVAWWEPVLSVAINLAILPFLIWIGSRLYRRGVLATSGKIKFREAIRALDLTSRK